MKWREPWRASLAEQPPYNVLGPEVRQGLIFWLAVNLGILILVALSAAADPSLSEIALFVVLSSMLMALVIYTIRWLSPRSVSLGPRGIVLVKADSARLLSWSAINTFDLNRDGSHAVLDLNLAPDSLVRLHVPAKIDIDAVAEQLERHIAL